MCGFESSWVNAATGRRKRLRTDTNARYRVARIASWTAWTRTVVLLSRVLLGGSHLHEHDSAIRPKPLTGGVSEAQVASKLTARRFTDDTSDLVMKWCASDHVSGQRRQATCPAWGW